MKSKKRVYKEKRDPITRRIYSVVQARFIDNSCERKKQYPSKNVARLKATKASHRSGDLIEAYKCRYTNSHWHIGHARKERVQS